MYSIRYSFHFDSFAIQFCFSVHSFNQVISSSSLRISSQTQLHSSITVHLLYTSLPGSTLHLLYNFKYYHVLIVLLADVATDTLINKTTPTAVMWEQSFCEILYHALTVQLCCFVLFRIGLNPVKKTQIVSRPNIWAGCKQFWLHRN